MNKSVVIMSDRGMIKWLPFNSVINSKELINSILKEKAKISKPNLSEEEQKALEEKIIKAYYMDLSISITYFQGGYIYNEFGKIKKIDQIYKMIHLNNKHFLFSQIIDIKEHL